MAIGIAIVAASSVFIAVPIPLSLGDWRASRGKRMFEPEPDEEADEEADAAAVSAKRGGTPVSG